MTVTFITNYMTHHQKPFCGELYALLGEDFHFIATNVMDEERVKMGWELSLSDIPYASFYDDDYDKSHKLVKESDVVICGGTHYSYIEERLVLHKLTFMYSERLYKKGRIYGLNPKSLMNKRKEHAAYKNDPVYLLCAGAYVAADFSLSGSYPGKKLCFGYFPETYIYDEKELMKKKTSQIPEILWTGRLIDWKHAELAVFMAERLKKEHTVFHLTMVGEGPEEEKIKALIDEKKLNECISLEPFMSPAEIRSLMERSDIYLMTSDNEEGWGAVVNEAMNAGCAVAASHAAGAVPYLIRHKENGLVFKSGDVRELTFFVKKLCTDRAYAAKLGRNAYRTINNTWNAKEAADRFLKTAEALSKGGSFLYEDGPLSPAPELTVAKTYKKLRETT